MIHNSPGGIKQEPVSKESNPTDDLEILRPPAFTRLSDKLLVGWKLLSLSSDYFERKFTSYQSVKRLEFHLSDGEESSDEEMEELYELHGADNRLLSDSMYRDRGMPMRIKSRGSYMDRLDDNASLGTLGSSDLKASNISNMYNLGETSTNILETQTDSWSVTDKNGNVQGSEATFTHSVKEKGSPLTISQVTNETNVRTYAKSPNGTTQKFRFSSRHQKIRKYEPNQLSYRHRDRLLARYTPYWMSYTEDEIHHETHPAPFWKSFPFLVNTETIDKPPFRTEMQRIHYKDNEYLKTGYRIMPSGSLIGALWSMLAWNHNEFVNIHSHFWAGVAWLIILIAMLFDPTLFGYQKVPEDSSIFIFFAISCCFVFFGSTSFHTFRCCSVHAYHRYLTVDFCGICNLLMSGVILISYFELKCFPALKMMMISFVFMYWLALLVITPCLVYFRITAERTMAFMLLIVLGLVSFCIRFIFDSSGSAWSTFPEIAFGYALTGLIIVCRTIKYPEKLFPKTFDIFGASHQLWHIASAWLSFYCFNVYVKNNNIGNFQCQAF